MSTVRSKDGTAIAYERAGSGPPLILVDGALCYRDSGPARKMAAELADRFTVFTYDRRGRGESGDTQPYSVAREVEDLEALIEAAGGRAQLVGFSSGAVLALEAARAGAAIDKIAAYEPPLIVDDSRSPTPSDYVPGLRSDLAAGRPGAAVKRFMRLVGMPGFLVALFPALPNWRKLKRVAPTLPYDADDFGRDAVRQTARLRALGCGTSAHRCPRRWQERGMDGQWDTQSRRVVARVGIRGARRPVAHGQGEGARAGTEARPGSRSRGTSALLSGGEKETQCPFRHISTTSRRRPERPRASFSRKRKHGASTVPKPRRERFEMAQERLRAWPRPRDGLGPRDQEGPDDCDKHVDSTGSHSDAPSVLRLDGK